MEHGCAAIRLPADRREIGRLTFGPGSAEPPAEEAQPGIDIQHARGDLSYVKHPLLVGHYLGDSIVSAGTRA